MGLLDKIMNKDEKVSQLQGELSSLQLRKESIVSAIQDEINKLQNEKNSVFCDSEQVVFIKYFFADVESSKKFLINEKSRA